MGVTVSISECKDGDILFTDIINSTGVVLAAKNTVLNQYIIKHLFDQGINKITIYAEVPSSGGTFAGQDFTRSYNKTVHMTKEILQELAAGEPLNYRKLTSVCGQIKKSILSDNIIRLLTQIKKSDEYTYLHSVNTAFYSMMIGKWLKLPENDVDMVIQAGLLHDVGKTKIPSEVLNKKGRLTEEEFDLIKKHTILGYEILKDNEEICDDIKLSVLLHHERLDGSGYPYHYLSDRINPGARIVAMADVFDAMTSDRVYKKRVTPFEVFDMYLTEGACLFDTKLMSVFMKNMAVYLTGSNVLLNNGEIGEIVYIPLHDITCPVVKVQSEYYDISKDEFMKIISIM